MADLVFFPHQKKLMRVRGVKLSWSIRKKKKGAKDRFSKQ